MTSPVVFVMLTFFPDVENVINNLQLLKDWPGILVDNTPGEFPKKQLPKPAVPHEITPIYSGKNLGYAGGMNAGIQLALKRRADWIVVMNDDLRLNRASVAHFFTSFAKFAPGILGPFSGKLDRKRWTTVYPTSDNEEFDYLSGSCLAIHRDVVSRVGMFYEPYFIYYEDVELCLRAKKAGFPLRKTPRASFGHQETTTVGKGSAGHEYYLARNHLLFVERNAPTRVKLYEIARMPKTLWEYYKNGNRGAMVGVRDYALRRFGEVKVNL